MKNEKQIIEDYSMKLQPETPDTKHHYFASCVFGWAAGYSEKHAIEKCLNQFRQEAKRTTAALHKEGKNGFYVWSCRVHEPYEANYQINFFKPEGVKISEGKHHNVTYITNTKIAYHTPKESK